MGALWVAEAAGEHGISRCPGIKAQVFCNLDTGANEYRHSCVWRVPVASAPMFLAHPSQPHTPVSSPVAAGAAGGGVRHVPTYGHLVVLLLLLLVVVVLGVALLKAKLVTPSSAWWWWRCARWPWWWWCSARWPVPSAEPHRPQRHSGQHAGVQPSNPSIC